MSAVARAASLPSASAPGAPAQALLVASGITRGWRRSAVPVLRDVDLAVGAGEAVAVVGRNGVGKTTLLRVLAGLIAPDAGTVRLGGLDPERHRRGYQRRIGFLAAGDRGLYARLSVRGHLDYWAALALMPRPRRAVAIAHVVERFVLAELADRRVDRLSMGQRQRVRLALTFLHDPELVLLDEPVNSLDDEGREMLAGAVDRLTRGGGAAVWCAPAGETLPEFVGRVATISEGRIAW